MRPVALHWAGSARLFSVTSLPDVQSDPVDHIQYKLNDLIVSPYGTIWPCLLRDVSANLN